MLHQHPLLIALYDSSVELGVGSQVFGEANKENFGRKPKYGEGLVCQQGDKCT
jgi:hypothetical protein